MSWWPKMNTTLGIVLTVFAVLLFAAPQVQDALLVFIVAGVIPGFNVAVPPLLMLLLLGGGFVALVKWTRRQQFYLELQKQRAANKKAAPAKAKRKTKAAPTYAKLTRKWFERAIRHWA
ncbi:MAG: hypothetical protein ACREGJ_02940 [Candidatus Saccharimonadales bacterium]